MSISTYAELQTAIQEWLRDSDLAAKAPDFITLTEAKFNRVLVNTEMEETSSAAAAGVMALPAGVVTLRSLYLDMDPRVLLAYLTPEVFRASQPSQATGQPVYYTLVADQIYLSPSPDSSYSVVSHYTRSLVPLSDMNPSNWLLENHPDAYLFGSLAHAEFFGWNDSRLPVVKGAFDEMIDEINKQANRKRVSGGLRMRPSIVA